MDMRENFLKQKNNNEQNAKDEESQIKNSPSTFQTYTEKLILQK